MPWALGAFSAICGLILIAFVDLTPKLEENFFFSSDAPELQTENKISELFPRWPQIILNASGDIRSRPYLKDLASLTLELKWVKGVQSVASLGEGPASVEDALNSPLWRRLLFPNDESGSNLLAFLRPDEDHSEAVRAIEDLLKRYDAPHFRLAISGVPYVTYQIQTRLVEEIKLFSIAAFVLFSGLVLFLYRSLWVLIGCTISCATACFLTFIALEILGVEPGVLTANLWSIVFVLTLSHIVFITANYENLRREGYPKKKALHDALSATRPASTWAMVTTLLGFLTLLLTVAKPIRQFGLACSIGALVAIACAYLIYPHYLRLSKKTSSYAPALEWRIRRSVSHPNLWAPFAVLILALLALPGIKGIDLTPGLFSYFAPESALRRDLEKIDEQGGTSPLEIVVAKPDRVAFNTNEAYLELWELQLKLEKDPAVGSVISLPLFMTEMKSSLLSFLPWDVLFWLMDSPLFGEIGKGFITSNRNQALYFLRMRESGLKEPREQVVSRVEGIIRQSGFEPVLIGGLFRLQGQLSELVSKSLLQGLIGLAIFFSVIALLLSRFRRPGGLRHALVLIVSLFSVPIVVLGFIGYLRYPLDIISAPGFNIAVAIGIDDMIHLTYRVRSEGAPWDKARRDLWKPILASTLIVASGFATFGLSDYPPTRRLGLIVATGSALAVFISLFMMPTLARLWPFRARKSAQEHERVPETERLAG